MNIHEWIVSKPGSDADLAVRQGVFIRDRIGKSLFPTVHPRDVPIEVVGEHRSKSAVLPVCLAKFERVGGGSVCMRFRNNWYNWAISVQADHPTDVGGWRLFNENDATYLKTSTMDGFKEGQVFGPYSADRSRFSCLIWGLDEEFWMFCRLLRGK